MKLSREALFFGLVLPFGCVFAFAGRHDLGWFSRGEKPIDVGLPSSHQVLELQKNCVRCHGLAHKEWSESAHASSWVNPVFQEGFRLEPKSRCVNCHAPLKEQVQEFKIGKDLGLLQTGINCVACHVRGGEVHFSKENSGAPHPVVKDPEFGSAKFCAGCHEFKIVQLGSEPTSFAQSTFTEWLQYRESGGTKTCIQCHGSDTNHRFPASRDSESLPVAIKFSVKKKSGRIEFSIKNKDMGHAFPTGDMFREVVIEAKFNTEPEYRRIIWLGKMYEKKDGQIRLINDQRLYPKKTKFEFVEIPVNAKSISYRVRYFRSPEFIRKHSLLPKELWLRELLSGEIEFR